VGNLARNAEGKKKEGEKKMEGSEVNKRKKGMGRKKPTKGSFFTPKPTDCSRRKLERSPIGERGRKKEQE